MSTSSGAVWAKINYVDVRRFYDERMETHSLLIRLLSQGKVFDYVELALGMSDRNGNYSASEYVLGPRIVENSGRQTVFELARELLRCEPLEVPDAIYSATIKYLKISVGSEMALMLRPGECWVTNVRTLFAHFVLKYNGDIDKAWELLRLFREQDDDSEMAYDTWRSLHPEVGKSLSKIADVGSAEAIKQVIQPGGMRFLWADAIADNLYAKFSK